MTTPIVEWGHAYCHNRGANTTLHKNRFAGEFDVNLVIFHEAGYDPSSSGAFSTLTVTVNDGTTSVTKTKANNDFTLSPARTGYTGENVPEVNGIPMVPYLYRTTFDAADFANVKDATVTFSVTPTSHTNRTQADTQFGTCNIDLNGDTGTARLPSLGAFVEASGTDAAVDYGGTNLQISTWSTASYNATTRVITFTTLTEASGKDPSSVPCFITMEDDDGIAQTYRVSAFDDVTANTITLSDQATQSALPWQPILPQDNITSGSVVLHNELGPASGVNRAFWNQCFFATADEDVAGIHLCLESGATAIRSESPFNVTPNNFNGSRVVMCSLPSGTKANISAITTTANDDWCDCSSFAIVNIDFTFVDSSFLQIIDGTGNETLTSFAVERSNLLGPTVADPTATAYPVVTPFASALTNAKMSWVDVHLENFQNAGTPTYCFNVSTKNQQADFAQGNAFGSFVNVLIENIYEASGIHTDAFQIQTKNTGGQANNTPFYNVVVLANGPANGTATQCFFMRPEPDATGNPGTHEATTDMAFVNVLLDSEEISPSALGNQQFAATINHLLMWNTTWNSIFNLNRNASYSAPIFTGELKNTVFRQYNTDGTPTLTSLNSQQCHALAYGGAYTLPNMTNVTTGSTLSALFADTGSDDWTPKSGTDIYDAVTEVRWPRDIYGREITAGGAIGAIQPVAAEAPPSYFVRSPTSRLERGGNRRRGL